MKRVVAIALAAFVVLSLAVETQARVVRVRRGPAGRVRVTTRPGFPIRRTLPNVVIRTGPVVRVAPRVYIGAVAVTAVALATRPPANVRAWTATEEFDREDGWTVVTMDIDRRGTRLVLEVEEGPAQISFAEVVFENGEAQVVDFNDRVQSRGVYSLLDFKDGRKVDHVRLVAKAQRDETRIRVHLVT